MDIAAIMQIIMTIITMIMELIGGGKFPGMLTPNQNSFQFLAAHQYTCSEPYWPQAGKISRNVFTGVAAMDCKVQGATGGGFIELRNHLLSQMPESSVSYTEAAMELFEGVPSLGMKLSLDVSANGKIVPIDGTAHVVTDGFSGLRNIFVSEDIGDEGGMKYLQQIREELVVTRGASTGWYQVRMLYAPQVQRPGLMNVNSFKKQVMDGAEETLRLRRERVLNDVAAHL